MSVTIRLARYGRRKKPFYRVVATDSKNKRDGRFIETVGTLDPLIDPPKIDLKEDRVKHWIAVGAKPSQRVAHAIEKVMPGLLPELEKGRLEKVRAQRAARKQRAKA